MNFNGKPRDEFPCRDVFDTLVEAKVLVECWRKAHNTAAHTVRTRAIPWQCGPDDRNWFHHWGEVKPV